MLNYYEDLSALDNTFKSLKRPEYLRVLKARLSLLIEAMHCLDVSEDQYGYIIPKGKDSAKSGCKPLFIII